MPGLEMITRPTVLFVCVHNAGRSQMAAGFLRSLSQGAVVALSGGSEPASQINRVAVQAMAEVGIDIAPGIPRLLETDDVRASDVVITMGCGDACPVFPGKTYEDWELADPAGRGLDEVRVIRDDIRARVETLLEQLTTAEAPDLEMRLELIPLPVSDVDRSRSFYVDQVGFTLDHDVQPGNGMRVVQLTPPGSACSIVIGEGMLDPASPPVQGLHLVVADLDAVRERLVERGVAVSPVAEIGGGVSIAHFSDPDGNTWAVQQISR